MELDEKTKIIIGIFFVLIFLGCVFVGSGTSLVFDTNSDKSIINNDNKSNTTCVRNYVPEMYYYNQIGNVVPDFDCQSARFTKYTYGGETLINIGIVLFLSALFSLMFLGFEF